MKNIVFDFGNVIVKFRPEDYCARFTSNKEEIALLCKKVFGSLEWVRLDRGVIEEEAAKQEICSTLPESLHQAACGLIDQWYTFLETNQDICQLIYRIKAAGYPVYLLSNISTKLHAVVPKMDVLQQFTGIFISADVHLLKPDLDIYRCFLEKFDLKPSECYFIDDNLSNIEAAMECGMHGFCYDGDCEKLVWWLEKKEILPSGF